MLQRLMAAAFAFTATLTVAACGAGVRVAAPSESSTPAVAEIGAIPVQLSDYRIDPAAIRAAAGHRTFAVTNRGQAPHNLTIMRSDATGVLAASRELLPGRAEVLAVDLSPGVYPIMCSEPGHASLGMTGTLTVT